MSPLMNRFHFQCNGLHHLCKRLHAPGVISVPLCYGFWKVELRDYECQIRALHRP